MEAIRKQLSFTYMHLLQGKLFNFARKSCWKLLLASAMLAVAWPEISPSLNNQSLAVRFGCILAVVLPLYLLLIMVSARIQAKKFAGKQWLLVINAQGLSLVKEEKAPPVQWSWAQVQGIYKSNRQWVFRLPGFPQYLALPLHKLTPQELETLGRWVPKKK